MANMIINSAHACCGARMVTGWYPDTRSSGSMSPDEYNRWQNANPLKNGFYSAILTGSQMGDFKGEGKSPLADAMREYGWKLVGISKNPNSGNLLYFWVFSPSVCVIKDFVQVEEEPVLEKVEKVVKETTTSVKKKSKRVVKKPTSSTKK